MPMETIRICMAIAQLVGPSGLPSGTHLKRELDMLHPPVIWRGVEHLWNFLGNHADIPKTIQKHQNYFGCFPHPRNQCQTSHINTTMTRVIGRVGTPWA